MQKNEIHLPVCSFADNFNIFTEKPDDMSILRVYNEEGNIHIKKVLGLR